MASPRDRSAAKVNRAPVLEGDLHSTRLQSSAAQIGLNYGAGRCKTPASPVPGSDRRSALVKRRDLHLVCAPPVPQQTEADAMPSLRQPNFKHGGVQPITPRNHLVQRAGRQLECRPISRLRGVLAIRMSVEKSVSDLTLSRARWRATPDAPTKISVIHSASLRNCNIKLTSVS